jgi:hypothetical protein
MTFLFFISAVAAAGEESRLINVPTEPVRTVQASKRINAQTSTKPSVQTRTEAVIEADGSVTLNCKEGHDHEWHAEQPK